MLQCWHARAELPVSRRLGKQTWIVVGLVKCLLHRWTLLLVVFSLNWFRVGSRQFPFACLAAQSFEIFLLWMEVCATEISCMITSVSELTILCQSGCQGKLLKRWVGCLPINCWYSYTFREKSPSFSPTLLSFWKAIASFSKTEMDSNACSHFFPAFEDPEKGLCCRSYFNWSQLYQDTPLKAFWVYAVRNLVWTPLTP